jgi:hypothetical protein
VGGAVHFTTTLAKILIQQTRELRHLKEHVQGLQTLDTPDSGLKERCAALDDVIGALENHEDMSSELETAYTRRAAIQHRLSLKQELESTMSSVRCLSGTSGVHALHTSIELKPDN